jgi:16S rRNA (uracil1498-N3)-methyltransferase
MSDHWLYAEDLPSSPADWVLEGIEAQHARAKRLQVEEAVHLFDGRGRLACARVRACDKRGLRVRIETIEKVPPQRPQLAVAVSQPKGERLDWMLEKLTELGVAEIWPLECERSVAHARQERPDRWQRKLIEAAKQAHVAWLPTLVASHKLPQLLGRVAEFEACFVADTSGQTMSILAAAPVNGDRLLLIIGPEGGFSDAEREQMQSRGLRRVTLGTTVLRTETAAIVAAGCLLAAARLAAGDTGS